MSGTTELGRKQVMVMVGVLIVADFVLYLNETTFAVALPGIMADFGIDAATAQWLTTGFLLTMAIIIPTTGFLLQQFNTKRLFMIAILTFIVGTVIGAVAPSFVILMIGRVLQAAATAVVLPMLMTATITLISPGRRGTVMGLIGVVVSAAPMLGPTVAGLVLDSFTWHALFWVMLPIIIPVFIVGALTVGDISAKKDVPFDAFSVVLAAFAFGGIVYGLSTAADIVTGGGGASIAALIVGAVFLVLFVWCQRILSRTDRALLDLRPLAVRNFTAPLVVVMAGMALLLSTAVVLPIYLQNSLLLTTLVTGLLLLPGGLFQGVFSPIVGRIYDSVGPRPLVIPGVVLMTVSHLLLAALLDETTAPAVVVALHVLMCVGMALLLTPMLTLSLSELPRDLYGHGSAILNTMQQVAGAAGTAILVAAMTLRSDQLIAGDATEAAAVGGGTSAAFLVGGFIGVIGIIAALFIRTPNRAAEAVQVAEPAR